MRSVSLDDKYDLTHNRIFVSGFQAIVRLCLMQREMDRRAGLNTAGFITGYRGSPLGGLDRQFERAQKQLEEAQILFQPGLNEDLAATAVWGCQQTELRGEGRYDGVFGLWYGKGPGVDRSGDVLRHANLAGTSRHGGVLAFAGDDHTAESSTTAHQSEFRFTDVMMPVLSPGNLQEIIDYGLYGWAMSRYSGTWTAIKTTHDTVEATGVIEASPERMSFVTPDFHMPEGGLNIRLKDTQLAKEARLHDFKRDAVLAFLSANRINRVISAGGRTPKVGILTGGKAYLDVLQALDELGLDEVKCAELGLRIFKLGCVWPLDRHELMRFAEGLDTVIVVEEKASLVEAQFRELLYGAANQPLCIGKKDERGQALFPASGAIDAIAVALCIGERLLKHVSNEDLAARVNRLRDAQRQRAGTKDVAQRLATFCSGCPHNTSTVVPEGMRAYAGIGCHYMAQWMDRSTDGYTHMGAEGANWMGEAPFSTRQHVFQNLGDGTYNHSGSLAIRAAIASGVNITYKVLYNDAVAMTGGQRNDGPLTVPSMARQIAAEGVARIVVATDEPDKYDKHEKWPAGLTIHHRDELVKLQTDLAAVPGVTVLIYDQTCAAEKRRRRKRGTYPDPDKRVVINERVCEGCGDCGVKSNCASVQPLETEFGRKRRIDQTSCNKDFSCVKGFCPSFVTVEGASLRKPQPAVAPPHGDIPDPVMPSLDKPFALIVTGVGGTGVVTLGGILGMAAHLEGNASGVIDMSGLAQKGGAVHSHLRIAARLEDLRAVRIAQGGADLVIGGDVVVAGTRKVLGTVREGDTTMVLNTAEFMPGEFARDADFTLPSARIRKAITRAAGEEQCHFIDATGIADERLGSSICANVFLVGYAYQLGALPISAAAIESAIHLNGEAVPMNLAAFRLGRLAVIDKAAVVPANVLKLPASPHPKSDRELSESLDEIIARRVTFLTDYQNAAYASRYSRTIEKVRAAETRATPDRDALTTAVAHGLFKLMAYKDEYEVARLYADGSFEKRVREDLAGDNLRFKVHLAPPLFARRDPLTGEPKKMTFGPWIFKAFRVLARLKGLRGTVFDIFGYTAERRLERRLIADYVALLADMLPRLDDGNHATAVALAALPEKMRGFGHIKRRNVEAARAEEASLREQFLAGTPYLKAAE